MNFLSWSKSIKQKLDHEKALYEQYVTYVKSSGKAKPKLKVGKRNRTTYPLMYKLTNPKANDWTPASHDVSGFEEATKERVLDKMHTDASRKASL